MQVYQFEAFSSGPRLGIVKGLDLFSLNQANSLQSLASQAKQRGETPAKRAESLISAQQFNFNELVLDGRIRPPLWHEQASQLQLWERDPLASNGKAAWRMAADGAKVCRPYMPLPARAHETLQPALLIAGSVGGDGRPHFIGQTLGFFATSSAPLGWSFGAGVSLAELAWGQTVNLRFSVSRMAEEIWSQDLEAQLPADDEIQAFNQDVPLMPGALFILRCAVSNSNDQADLPPSLEHGDALLLEAPALGLELRNMLHHPEQADAKWQG